MSEDINMISDNTVEVCQSIVDHTGQLELIEIDPNDLLILEEYQRGFSITDARRIVKNFEPSIFLPILVGKRKDGSLYIVDGQHRWAAAKLMRMNYINCLVFESNGIEHEATIFRRANTSSRRLNALDTYKAALRSGDYGTIKINNCLIEYGYYVSFKGHEVSTGIPVKAVQTLYQLLRWGKGNIIYLEQAIKTIKQIWPGNKDAVDNNIIGGVGLLVKIYAGKYSHTELCNKIRVRHRDPSQLLTLAAYEAKTLKSGEGGRKKLICEFLAKEYNKGRKKANRLDLNILTDEEE